MDRGVAQPGSASVLGTEGREFESLRPDHLNFSDFGLGGVLASRSAASCPMHDHAIKLEASAEREAGPLGVARLFWCQLL